MPQGLPPGRCRRPWAWISLCSHSLSEINCKYIFCLVFINKIRSEEAPLLMPQATLLVHIISDLCALESSFNSILPSVHHTPHLFFPF